MTNLCVVGENCCVYDRVHKLPGVAYPYSICTGCFNRCKSDLNMLRYDYVDLAQLMVPRETRSDANIFRTKPESSPPLDLQVLTLRSDIAEALVATEDAMRERLRDRPRDTPTREGYSVDQAVRYLEARVDHIAEIPTIGHEKAPDGISMLGWYSTLHRRARRAAGLLLPSVKVAGSCPRCAVTALRRHADDHEKVWCGHCHQQMSRDDYHKSLRMQLAP